jgi:hypothetical protein
MGADMMLAYARVDQDKSFWLDGLAEATDKQLVDYADEYDHCTLFPEDDDEQFSRATLIRQAIVDAVEMCYSESREIAVCEIGGVRYACTGGLSWGDAPTDAFDYVLMFQWVQEDCMIPGSGSL